MWVAVDEVLLFTVRHVYCTACDLVGILEELSVLLLKLPPPNHLNHTFMGVTTQSS